MTHGWSPIGNRDALLAQAWIITGLSWLHGNTSQTAKTLADGDVWWPLIAFTALSIACAFETACAATGHAMPRIVSGALWKVFGLALGAQAVVFGVLAGWALVPIWTGYVWLAINASWLGLRITRGAT